jgi:hypothetical protein
MFPPSIRILTRRHAEETSNRSGSEYDTITRSSDCESFFSPFDEESYEKK